MRFIHLAIIAVVIEIAFFLISISNTIKQPDYSNCFITAQSVQQF